ncbi:MAG: TonB-dependent receptor [Chitinophagales bacterium]|nr:TonB-dependent receptor [Chitinophagales bacterium]
MKQLFFLISQFTLISLFAQTGVITGTIYDEINNEPLIGANILIQNTNYGAITDVDGNYTIENLPTGLYNVQVTYIGYQTQTRFEVEVTNAKPVIINFAMAEETMFLDSIVIKANPFEKKSESPLSFVEIGIDEIQRNPGGNRDISRAIQNLPGVATGVGYRNDLLVRGGAPSENKFLLDDIEIPTINHFATQGASGGSNGILNVDFINNASFYTGAFPANYSNAMSSVLKLTQKEGRKDKLGMNFTLGASEAGITLEGPLTKKKKTTFLLNGRYSYLQGLFKLIGLPFLPSYTDVQTKVMHKFNNKHDITFIGVGAFDKLRLNKNLTETADQRYLLRTLPQQEQWNYTIGARYRYYKDNSNMLFVLSRSSFGNHIYKYNNNIETNNELYDLNAKESENKFRFEHTYRVNSYKIAYGLNAEYNYYNTTTSNFVLIDSNLVDINYKSNLNLAKYGLFAQVSRSFIDDKLSLSFGVRLDGLSYNKKMANLLNQISPRFSLSYAILPQLSFNFNTGIYYQTPQYTTLGYRDNNNNLVNKNQLEYIRNYQVVAGFSSSFTSNTKVSVEAFYKYYNQYPYLIEKGIALANLGGNYGWVGDEPTTSTAKGKTYGIEVAVQQKLWKGIYGIASYTWFRSLFTDKTQSYQPSSWDARHVLNITTGYKFKRNWEIGIRFNVQGALPYTPYDTTNLALIDVWNASNGLPFYNYDEINAMRLKVQHSLNLRVDKKWFFQKWNFNIYLDIQNLYASKFPNQPNIDVVRDANDTPIANPSNPNSYQLIYLENNSGSTIPSIGLVIGF